jgi:hypothetical protein
MVAHVIIHILYHDLLIDAVGSKGLPGYTSDRGSSYFNVLAVRAVSNGK